MQNTIQIIKKTLNDSIDSTPEKVSIFFKTGIGEYAENDKFIGVTVPTLRKIAKNFVYDCYIEDLDILIRSPINEERLLTLMILIYKYKTSIKEQKEEIYQFYKKNLYYINNWNLVDSSAHLIIGAHLFDKDRSLLEELARSSNLWERRIAIIATLYFIRKYQLKWTFKIAKLLQNDQHDLIHKAVGWMLREAGKKDEIRLVSFLCNYKDKMPKTMLRYAMEKFSTEQKILIKNFSI
ncbi:DNA alkylation repair protein [Lyticum sinuosum]|uniref:DNA alkylation repair enzyme n=1 Tax=Lyticum sinuosum TaxID=1332059 RepID=A0AAE5AHL6_9RICK|nr:DNA alkylation repair protein [Lyticum sinuosum]MDZ5761176.1 DNA alkylation repair enzyme [Lyticum sinuosum]